MTLTLGLDTATAVASVAVGDDHGLIASMTLGRRRHAAALVPVLTQVLRHAGGTLRDVERIVLADGPGSFTGLRIGVATVQGIVRVHDSIRVWTAPALLAVARAAARGANEAERVAALFDALRGEVFGAVYRFVPGGLEALVEPVLGPVERLVERVAMSPAIAVGDGALRYADVVRRWTGRDPIGSDQLPATAGALLDLPDLAGGARPMPDPEAFDPDYGRPAEAQARWERQHGRPLPDAPGRSL